MAKINNVQVSTESHMLLFSNVRNILSIGDTDIPTDRAEMTIEVESLASVDMDATYTLEINGRKITSVNSYSKAKGNHFLLVNTNTEEQRIRVARTVCNALKSVPELSVNYNIYIDEDDINPTVKIEAKKNGSSLNMSYTSDFQGFDITNTPSSSSSTLENCTVYVDVYGDDGYVTTLSKMGYGGDMYFNLSDLFSTMTETGGKQDIRLIIRGYDSDGLQNYNEEIGGVTVVSGYEVNEGIRYLDIEMDGPYVLQNYSKGGVTPYDNSTVLYVGEPSISLSLFSPVDMSRNIYIGYMSKGGEVLAQQTYSASISDKVSHNVIPLSNVVAWNKADSITLTVEGTGTTVNYKVIKPLNAHSKTKRLYFYNSYGGLSFFDFVGDVQEERKISESTVNDSPFYFYGNRFLQSSIAYRKSVQKSYSLQTHIISEDAIWTLYDMQLSTCVYTEGDDGKMYRVDVDDIEIDKLDEATYRATVKINYSLNDSN